MAGRGTWGWRPHPLVVASAEWWRQGLERQRRGKTQEGRVRVVGGGRGFFIGCWHELGFSRIRGSSIVVVMAHKLIFSFLL